MSAKTERNSEIIFNRLCSELDLTKENGLVEVDTDARDEFQRYILKQAKEKLGADAVFFLNFLTSKAESSVPLIYFHKLESKDPQEIAKLHKIAWNMGRAPLLFIIRPEVVLVYNANEPPKKLKDGRLDEKAGLIDELNLFVNVNTEIKKLKKYHRSELVTGSYWQKHGEIFKKEKRVYQTLLKNLEFMREKLIGRGLPPEIVHSLLSRSIFIKYLEDRTDANNNNVFPEGFFDEYLTGAECFTDLLSDREATYSLFRYLEDRFNGSIFTLEDNEESIVTQTLDVLPLLQDLLKAEKYLASGQMTLWPLYSFDVIPIELISNIYQQFFHYEMDEKETDKEKTPKKKREINGTHYTPPHLVTFLLDEVLPWDGEKTDVKTLDPSCGSGIFLVETYRRLISRWMQANDRDDPSPDDLTDILKKNIFGVDKDRNAVRIAALSLYLTMCDYLPPRDIWDKKVRFEPLINENNGNNLFVSDFFEKDFSNEEYDLIVGNPPWESKLSGPAKTYIDERSKPIGDKQICQAFLWRVAELCKPSGEICMYVSSKALLFNRSGPNKKFRKQFLSTFNVKTIINFSALRHVLFPDAVAPGAVVIFSPNGIEDSQAIFYCSPKPSYSPQDDWLLIIEPQDINHIPKEEAIDSDIIWKVAMWGTPRDYELIKQLSKLPSIERICADKGWIDGEGFKVGNKRDHVPELSEKPYVHAKEMQRFAINEESLPDLGESYFEGHAKTKREIFRGPHLLIKQSPKAGVGLIAALLKNDAVFSQSVVGIHAKETDLSILSACCLPINTNLPLYYSMLTSSRWLVERDEFTKKETMSLPMPEDILKQVITYDFLKELSKNPNAEEIVNDLVDEWYGLDESKRILVNDAIDFTLDSFRNKDKSIAFKKVDRSTLENYTNTFSNVLNNSFSSPKKVFVGTVYLGKCPLQVVSARLVDKSKEVAEITFVKDNELEDVLKELDKALIEEQSPSVYIRRNLRRYSGNTVHIVKPNQMRCWTKSSALHDADETYADIMLSWGDIK